MPRRRHSHFQTNPNICPEVGPMVRLWILRLLVPLGGHREFICTNGFDNDAVALALGLGNWIDPPDGDFDVKSARTKLRQLHAAGERELPGSKAPICLSANVERLARLVGLTEVDRRIVEFAVLIYSERLLDLAAEWLGSLSTITMQHAMAVLLDLPEGDIRSSLNPQSALARSGLLSVERSGSAALREKFRLLSDNFADHIVSIEMDPVGLLRDTVRPSSPALLNMSDYLHIEEFLSLLRQYLRHALATRRPGVNIFLHGLPGTGKSQLAKVLCDELECELFEITSEDSDGDPITGQARLRAFRAAQCVLATRRVVILFDEVEDVFLDGDHVIGRSSTAQSRKAWLNRMLEENCVPTLWLSNSIDGLDPAFVRRFDMVFELPVPPRELRQRIIERACNGMLDPVTIDRFAESSLLTPAVVDRASKVVASIRGDLGAGCADAIELLVNNTLTMQGHPIVGRDDPSRPPEIYDPALIRADADLLQVARGLVHARSGRLCLYGPPGTGKSAFGRWLAGEIGVPLHVKRASDLMSKWVGDNERNIARAFSAARQEGALLLIDEVDSFLQDRRGADHSWEVTMVNEMLTQMESFPGVFIASTNLMDGLDQAALRRFDLKVKFGFLHPDQASDLMHRYCAILAIAMPKAIDCSNLRRQDRLTPGDFAAVLRQHRFRPIRSASDLVAALAAECEVKDGTRTAIGFVH